jgi:hypothetical protein
MNASHALHARTAPRRAMHRGGVPFAATFAMVGGLADSGFGLVVVDQGNPRRGGASTLLAIAN